MRFIHPEKIFKKATLSLHTMEKKSFLYYFYLLVEQTFIFLNKYLPLHRINTKEVTKEQLTNKEHMIEYNIPLVFFTQEKKLGVSGVARLKNWWEFLKIAIESYLPLLNELILVDNNSTDDTVAICLEFQSKYPEKVKFYNYEPEVYDSNSWINIWENSVHSLSYYYNWSFSKATYSHVMKIDDDNIAIQSEYKKLIKKVLSENKKWFYATRWLQIFEKNGHIGVFWNYPYSGRYGDHGIYKITPKTYYIQNWACEKIVYPYTWVSYGFTHIHLKFMKKNYGYNNYIKDPNIMKEKIKEISESECIPLSKFISWDFLKKTKIILEGIFRINKENNW